MKLAKAIRETVLREARVVAGENSLEREISWVHMVDHPDIVGSVNSGELLLTTGYNWPKGTAATRALFKNLGAIGLAGVVLAVPHYRKHFPPEAISEANRAGLPLLELPWAVRFSQVTHEVLAEVISFRSEMTMQRLHRALTNAAISASNLSDIAIALSDLLGRAVTFSDPRGHVLGGSGTGEELAALEPKLLDVARGETRLVDLNDVVRPITVEYREVNSVVYWLSLPVRLHDSVTALIWLELAGPEPDEVCSRAIEHASVLAAFHLMHQRQLTQQEDRLGYAFVSGLLDGEFEPSTSALERALVCGWNESQSYRVCLVLLDEPIPLTRESLQRRRYFVDTLRRHLQAKQLPVLFSLRLNQVKFIVPAEVSPEALWKAVSDRHAAMAVSRIHTGIKGMGAGSKDVDSLISRLRPGRVHHFDEILFPRALLGDADARDLLVDRLVTLLTGNRRRDFLLETLAALADQGFQFVNTAKVLRIHISTLRYRLDRIESILSVSLEDQRVRFELKVIVAFFRLRED